METYTSDIAEGMIKYGVYNGFDAWRRLYNHYVPLAEDFLGKMATSAVTVLSATCNTGIHFNGN